jgi:ABC-2 type transport system ATP-binding protein
MIHRAIEQFTGEGKTVLLSTHFMEEADRLCDKIAFINEGKIVTITPPSKLKSKFGSKQIEVVLSRDESKIKILHDIVDQKYIKLETDKIVIELPLHKNKLGVIIDQLKEEFEILSIHTREATLHQVFLELIKQ